MGIRSLKKTGGQTVIEYILLLLVVVGLGLYLEGSMQQQIGQWWKKMVELIIDQRPINLRFR